MAYVSQANQFYITSPKRTLSYISPLIKFRGSDVRHNVFLSDSRSLVNAIVKSGIFSESKEDGPVDRSGEDLRGAWAPVERLDEANLDNSDLSNAELCCASLYQASMMYALLTSVNAPFACFEGANLSFAVITLANVNNANFKDARLDHVDFSGTQAQEVTFDGADLSWSKLKECDVQGSTFRGCKMLGTSFSMRVSLDKTELRVAKRASVASYESEFLRLENEVGDSGIEYALRKISKLLDIDMKTNIMCFPRGDVFKAKPDSTSSYVRVFNMGFKTLLRILSKYKVFPANLKDPLTDIALLLTSRGKVLSRGLRDEAGRVLKEHVARVRLGQPSIELEDVSHIRRGL
jgi:uncharacterized protein YjbI with pentapeptide repeats